MALQSTQKDTDRLILSRYVRTFNLRKIKTVKVSLKVLRTQKDHPHFDLQGVLISIGAKPNRSTRIQSISKAAAS